ncbi:MAG: hypothetical protein ACI8VR_002859, partial [Candidatus Azotimanducaceae bacterium]
MSTIFTSALRTRIPRHFGAHRLLSTRLLSLLLCASTCVFQAHAANKQNLPQFGDATSG